jgi:hypothetical protein
MNGKTFANLFQLPTAENLLNYKHFQSVNKLIKWKEKNRSDNSRLNLLKEKKMDKVLLIF